MAAADSGRFLDNTASLADYCEHVVTGYDADVTEIISAFDHVIEYRERIGLHDQMLAKQFDGFNAPRYRVDRGIAPGTAESQWQQASNNATITDTTYTVFTTGDHLLCRVTATLEPQSVYALDRGDISIIGLLSDDRPPTYGSDQ